MACAYCSLYVRLYYSLLPAVHPYRQCCITRLPVLHGNQDPLPCLPQYVDWRCGNQNCSSLRNADVFVCLPSVSCHLQSPHARTRRLGLPALAALAVLLLTAAVATARQQ
jgi:hypothetical protein